MIDVLPLTWVPTIHPRYTVTDTGDVRKMLDLAERHWPEVKDRRVLLLRLARIGRDAIGLETAAAERARVRELQLAASRGPGDSSTRASCSTTAITGSRSPTS